jgi:hypothetical protein
VVALDTHPFPPPANRPSPTAKTRAGMGSPRASVPHHWRGSHPSAWLPSPDHPHQPRRSGPRYAEMADGQTFCRLVRALSRPPDAWRHRARHGQSTGPKSGQSCLAHGGAESAEASELSRRLLSPHA